MIRWKTCSNKLLSLVLKIREIIQFCKQVGKVAFRFIQGISHLVLPRVVNSNSPRSGSKYQIPSHPFTPRGEKKVKPLCCHSWQDLERRIHPPIISLTPSHVFAAYTNHSAVLELQEKSRKVGTELLLILIYLQWCLHHHEWRLEIHVDAPLKLESA